MVHMFIFFRLLHSQKRFTFIEHGTWSQEFSVFLFLADQQHFIKYYRVENLGKAKKVGVDLSHFLL